ncbi:MAG: tetratricopeptide repeat protein [Armatimonas sp.]
MATGTLWRLTLLGQLHVEPLARPGATITRFRTQKAAALLAYLALRPGSQPRETLLAMLWPDAPPEAARNSLSVALSSLRNQLEPPELPVGCVFTADRQSIGLVPGAMETDVAAFLAHPTLTTYGGMLLPGFYDDWVFTEREVLAERFRAQVRAEARRASPEQKLTLAREATIKDPDYADEWAEWVPKGAVAEAVTAVPVPPEAPRTSAPQPIDALPAYPTRFFGREAEKARLLTLLGEARLVTLVGLGGLGKTRLALEALRQHSETVFVPLAERSDADAIIPAIRSALRLPPAPEEQESLIHALRQRQTTLLLDNLEHLGDGAAGVLYSLLGQVESLRIVATSRRALSLPGESLLPLTPLPLESAMALFTDRARAVLPDFHVNSRNAEALESLCRRLDGIPLAVELAASRARVLTPGQWLQRLESGLDAVAATSRMGVPERQRTLLATLRWSYDLLSPETQGFFAQLSVFRGGASLEAIEAVTSDPLALDRLAELTDHSLLTSTLIEGERLRFTLLETIREFAKSVFPTDSPARQQHAAYFAKESEVYAPRLRSQGGEAARHWFEEEQENLRTALEQYGQTDPPGLLRLATSVGRWWESSSAWNEASTWLERALGGCPNDTSDTREARSIAWTILGNIAHNQGRFDLAEERLTRALHLCEAMGDDQRAAKVYNNLSLIASLRQDLPTAISLTEKAIAMHRRVGAELDAAITQINLATLHGGAGDWEIAERLFAESAVVLERHENKSALAIAWANLGACAAQRGALDESEDLLRRSLALKEAQGDKFGQAWSLDNLAEVLLARNQFSEALTALQSALTLTQELGAWRLLPFVLLHLAQAFQTTEPERAASFLGACRRLRATNGLVFAANQQEAEATLEATLLAALGPRLEQALKALDTILPEELRV